MKNTGFQLDENYDLILSPNRDETGKIVSGFQIGDVSYQNQALLLKAHKGEFKENPTVGIGIEDICNDNDFALWKREITEQFEIDGMWISRLVISYNQLEIDAKYE